MLSCPYYFNLPGLFLLCKSNSGSPVFELLSCGMEQSERLKKAIPYDQYTQEQKNITKAINANAINIRGTVLNQFVIIDETEAERLFTIFKK